MINGSCGSSFSLKPGLSHRVLKPVAVQKLEGNVAREFQVLREEDLSHTSAAQFLQDVVMGDNSANHNANLRSQGLPSKQNSPLRNLLQALTGEEKCGFCGIFLIRKTVAPGRSRLLSR
jgi:hypothetical protein